MPRALVLADSQFGKGNHLYPERLAEQEANWAQALDVALTNQCDLVIHAGDVYEDREPHSDVRAAFQRPLVGYPLPVLAIVGNHDVKSATLPTPIELAGEDLGGGLLRVSRRPELIEAAGVVVATSPWVAMGRMVASTNGGSRDAIHQVAARDLLRIAEDLAARARTDYPGLPVVNVGHWALDRVWPAGVPAHEPVLPVDDLAALTFDAVAYGHVHVAERWGHVVSPGSPMCLDYNEADGRHGCWLLDVEPGGCEWSFVPLDFRPFVTLDWDAETVESMLDLPGPAATRGWTSVVEGAVVRLRYTASLEQARVIDEARVRQALLDARAHRVWQITPQVDRPTRARAAHVTGTLDPAAAVDAWLDGQQVGADLRFVLRVRAADYLRRAA